VQQARDREANESAMSDGRSRVKKIMDQQTSIVLDEQHAFLDLLIKHVKLSTDSHQRRMLPGGWNRSFVAYQEARTLRQVFLEKGSLKDLKNSFVESLIASLLKVEEHDVSEIELLMNLMLETKIPFLHSGTPVRYDGDKIWTLTDYVRSNNYPTSF
jgi:hypothetical protein